MPTWCGSGWSRNWKRLLDSRRRTPDRCGIVDHSAQRGILLGILGGKGDTNVRPSREVPETPSHRPTVWTPGHLPSCWNPTRVPAESINGHFGVRPPFGGRRRSVVVASVSVIIAFLASLMASLPARAAGAVSEETASVEGVVGFMERLGPERGSGHAGRWPYSASRRSVTTMVGFASAAYRLGPRGSLPTSTANCQTTLR